MTVHIQIVGAKELADKFKGIKGKIKQNIRIGLVEGGILLKEEVERSIEGQRAESRSVDTGAFLHSIETNPIGDGVKVFSTVSHAVFLEFGTSKMEERRHFRNSMERVKPIITDRLKDEIKRAIK